MITPAQCLEARKLLGWTLDGLAAHSRVPHSIIWKFEVLDKPPLNSWLIEAIQIALEAAGIEFTNGGEPGVKLRKAGV